MIQSLLNEYAESDSSELIFLNNQGSILIENEKYMKDILILLFVLFFPMIANAQDKPSFSFREVNHIRVATPGLFAKGNHIYLHLDSLKEHEYAFPLPGGKVISAYGTRGGIRGQISRLVLMIRFVLLLTGWYGCRNLIMHTEIW